jgi:GMP synthase-like glutamine amidotransferase
MHLAILMTNTDETEFAQAHPKDGEKFTTLINSVRPNWTTEVFVVKDGLFPDDLDRFGGFMITGSPASVHDDEPWVGRLLELIRRIHARGQKMFGACFGHQAIAKALGGKVGPVGTKYILGVTQLDVVERPSWAEGLGDTLTQYAAHNEQVTELPQGARVLLSSDGCGVGGFAIGNHIYTTQNHPEMDRSFIEELIRYFRDHFPDGTADAGLASLQHAVNTDAYAETIARFFEAPR